VWPCLPGKLYRTFWLPLVHQQTSLAVVHDVRVRRAARQAETAPSATCGLAYPDMSQLAKLSTIPSLLVTSWPLLSAGAMQSHINIRILRSYTKTMRRWFSHVASVWSSLAARVLRTLCSWHHTPCTLNMTRTTLHLQTLSIAYQIAHYATSAHLGMHGNHRLQVRTRSALAMCDNAMQISASLSEHHHPSRLTLPWLRFAR